MVFPLVSIKFIMNKYFEFWNTNGSKEDTIHRVNRLFNENIWVYFRVNSVENGQYEYKQY